MATGFMNKFKGKLWLPYSSIQQWGGGGASSPGGGNIFTAQGPVSGAGALSPGATAADNVIASYFVPANSFINAGKQLLISAAGNFAATANTKTVKIIIGSASATVGSTIGASGTTIATTGASTGNNVGWFLQSSVIKYGASGSNTQTGQEISTIVATTHGGVAAAVALTLTESSGFWVALTGNAATATTDIVATGFQIEGYN